MPRAKTWGHDLNTQPSKLSGEGSWTTASHGQIICRPLSSGSQPKRHNEPHDTRVPPGCRIAELSCYISDKRSIFNLTCHRGRSRSKDLRKVTPVSFSLSLAQLRTDHTIRTFSTCKAVELLRLFDPNADRSSTICFRQKTQVTRVWVMTIRSRPLQDTTYQHASL